MKEIWKDIKDYEGYQVSNLGNVRSIDRKKTSWNGHQNIEVLYKGKILKQHDLKGYNAVGLWLNGKMRNVPVHRLVAITFLDNDNAYPCINHIDGNKLNNNVNNLEWCTYSHNNKEAYRIGLREISDKQKERFRQVGFKTGKKVIQKDLLGNIIKVFNSTRQASLELGINQGNISMCCNGNRKSVGGYIWEYAKVGENYE